MFSFSLFGPSNFFLSTRWISHRYCTTIWWLKFISSLRIDLLVWVIFWGCVKTFVWLGHQTHQICDSLLFFFTIIFGWCLTPAKPFISLPLFHLQQGRLYGHILIQVGFFWQIKLTMRARWENLYYLLIICSSDW